MKLNELNELLNHTLEVLEKYLEEYRDSIYIYDMSIINTSDGVALIKVNASIKIRLQCVISEVSKFIYSTLSDLEDIEWVDYHRYNKEEDLYYFGVEFK